MFGKKTGDSIGSGRIDTIIGEGVTLSGTLESTGVIRIDGQFKGNIRHEGMLVVGPKGFLEANVKADAMAIAGEVRGDLSISGKLEILSNGKLFGDIRAGHLVIHEGAVFSGHSTMAPNTPALGKEKGADRTTFTPPHTPVAASGQG